MPFETETNGRQVGLEASVVLVALWWRQEGAEASSWVWLPMAVPGGVGTSSFGRSTLQCGFGSYS